MYDTILLPNGVRVVTEAMDGVRSAAVGIWVGVGSRMEKSTESGSAHFIEHMLFKGTTRRNAAQLAEDMDAIGGQCNAFTTRNSTCFYTRSLDTHLAFSSEILSEMFFDSLFDQKDVESERSVILDEMDMYRDSPEDLVTEQLMTRCFPGPLGRPILGRRSTLNRFTGESLRSFMQREYRPDRVVVALSGSCTDRDVQLLCDRFSALEPRKKSRVAPGVYTPVTVLKRKRTEQNQLVLAWEGLPIGSEDRFACQVFSTIFGEGLSSRLFQTVREKYGLCYSICSYTGSYEETGLFGIATAVGRETEMQALSLIRTEVDKMLQDGVTPQELSRARELIKANMVMGLESTTSRMNRIGSGVLQLGSVLSVDEVIERYDAVTADDVLRLARSIMRPEQLSFSAVGKVGEEEEYHSVLK